MCSCCQYCDKLNHFENSTRDPWNINYAFKLTRIRDPYHGYIPDLISSVTLDDAVKKLRLI
jgi:hypothetical protein